MGVPQLLAGLTDDCNVLIAFRSTIPSDFGVALLARTDRNVCPTVDCRGTDISFCFILRVKTKLEAAPRLRLRNFVARLMTLAPMNMSVRNRRKMASPQRTVELTQTAIDHTAVVEKVRSHQAGAVVLFLGTVRELTAGKRTESLDYEAYPEMAVKQINQLLDEAQTRWPVIQAAVVHRVGHLELGDIAVAVAVSTPHRKDAFEAGQWVMDRIKEVVPIWKKEHWADGSTEWVHPESGRPGAAGNGTSG